jgi:hypothetical protein
LNRRQRRKADPVLSVVALCLLLEIALGFSDVISCYVRAKELKLDSHQRRRRIDEACCCFYCGGCCCCFYCGCCGCCGCCFYCGCCGCCGCCCCCRSRSCLFGLGTVGLLACLCPLLYVNRWPSTTNSSKLDAFREVDCLLSTLPSHTVATFSLTSSVDFRFPPSTITAASNRLMHGRSWRRQ